MALLPITQWQETLDRMEASLIGAARALERAEERWEMAVAPSAGEGETPVTLDRLAARLEEWEEKLRGAAQLTASVEAELTERGEAVQRWRALFAAWQQLLQRQEHVSS